MPQLSYPTVDELRTRAAFRLPPVNDALTISISSDIIFAWTSYRERHALSAPARYYAHDLQRLGATYDDYAAIAGYDCHDIDVSKCDDEGGIIVETLSAQDCEQIREELDRAIDAAWLEAADRERRDDDELIVHDLVRLHHRVGLEVLFRSNDGEDVRNEIAALAERFDAIHLESAREIAALEADDAGFLGREARELVVELENPRLSTPSGDILPMPAPLLLVPSAPAPDLLKTSAEFIDGFVPPDYLLDGVLQRRFCYSLTAQTGVGKTTVAMRLAAHVATGRTLGGLDVQRGAVLYFAGENPTDIQMRWLGLTLSMGIDPATSDVHFVSGVVPFSQTAHQISQEIDRKGLQLALVVVDTAAAYFEGDDENSNTQAVDHARRIRSLTTLPGGPTVLVLCHPTKRAGDDDLIPRGGGAFLNEVDGNIALRKLDSLVTATALGKFRGPEFPPLTFELDTVRDHPKLRDTRGRPIPTVIARPVGADGQARIERRGREDEDAVLRTLCDRPGLSPTDIARALDWHLRATNGKPPAVHHLKAKRTLARLAGAKLVEDRRGNWFATQKGQQELNRMDSMTMASTPGFALPPKFEQG